jgi:hypothetical protein
VPNTTFHQTDRMPKLVKHHTKKPIIKRVNILPQKSISHNKPSNNRSLTEEKFQNFDTTKSIYIIFGMMHVNFFFKKMMAEYI